MAPKQTDPQFKLRMTPEIKEAIEVAAKANNRSMNAEILSRLEDSFRVNPSGSGATELSSSAKSGGLYTEVNVIAIAKPFLKLSEAAKYLAMSIAMFQKLVATGVFPKPVKIIDQDLWPLEELDKVIDAFKAASEEKTPPQ